jgi:hypothetical protein
VLKSKWLDGKRNRRLDDLIYVLIHDLLPEIEDRYERQTIGMHGDNLGEEREQDIRARAPEIPRAHIQQVEPERFLVRSSNQEKFYSIHSVLNECNCEDFPRVKFCKHLAAVQHYFGGAPVAQPSPIAPESCHAQESGNAASQENAAASLISAVDQVITLSRQLLTQAPRATPEMVKSVRAIRSHLSVVASATTEGQALPKKEAIAPNQLSCQKQLSVWA